MTNRKLAYIVKDQKPLVLGLDKTVQLACRLMWERRSGSVLIVDNEERLIGIFTGRDVVQLVANGTDAATTRLAEAMTPKPVTVAPTARAIDAIQAMAEGGFRHIPVADDGKIIGVVSRGDFKGMEFEEFSWDAYYRRAADSGNREISSIIQGQSPVMLKADATAQEACKQMSSRSSGSALVLDEHQRLCGIFTGRDAVRLLATDELAGAQRLSLAMTPHPMTIAPNGSAVDALRTMSDGGFRHLPVVLNGQILGVVSRSDFTGLEIDRLDEDERLAECIW